MHKLDQPQTTNTSKVRDAAAQIGEEAENAEKHCINNDLFHVKQIGEEEPSKAKLIRLGLETEHKAAYPNLSRDSINCLSYGTLSAIAASLTSSDKYERERAKKDVRRLVKLGKEQA